MPEVRKRILILIPRMGGGGTERVVSILANHLCEKYDLRISTLVSGESFYALKPEVELKSAGCGIDRASPFRRTVSMGKNFFRSIAYVRQEIRDFHPDLVFPLLEEMDLVTDLAARGLRGFRRIHSERNDPRRRNGMLQRQLERIYRSADLLVCQTETVAEYYRRVPRKTVIPNPADFASYPDRVPEAEKARIVSIGRLRKQKNILLLEKAFAAIAEQFPEATVTVYGEGPERRRLEAEIRKDGLEGRFLLPGASGDVLNQIRDAAVFALPTEYEGFPNALIEAVAMGIPVVTTDFASGVAREIVKEDVGIVVPVGDTTAFAGGLEELLRSRDKREQIRKASRKAVEPFAAEKVIAAWDRLLETLLEDGACPEGEKNP